MSAQETLTEGAAANAAADAPPAADGATQEAAETSIGDAAPAPDDRPVDSMAVTYLVGAQLQGTIAAIRNSSEAFDAMEDPVWQARAVRLARQLVQRAAE
ncbi:MAG: hypothetical protein AB7G28_22710 [Pirellulales bacterium]